LKLKDHPPFMKALVKVILFAGLAFGMFGCAEDDNAALNDPLRLNFKITSKDQTTANLPVGTSLKVSLEKPDGEPVYTLEPIPFEKSSDGFTTSALDLPAGAYILTEFALVNNEGKILYTIPYSDSPLNEAVTSPLGINMEVNPADNRVITTEALDVTSHTPLEFGLATFNTNNSFLVSVNETGSTKAVAAKAVILKEGVTVATFDLPSKRTRIAFEGDLNDTYQIVISRDACTQYVADFILADWASEYEHKALKITLDPAFTMTGYALAGGDYPFYFYIGAEGANLSVNWGDGSIEEYSVNEPSGIEISHAYAVTGTYSITVTGDLDKIVHFYSFYGGSEFSNISFRHLTNLRELLYGLTACPSTIDLSANARLEFAVLLGLRDLETLILPEEHAINFLEVDGDNLLNTDDVDGIINNIYSNVIASGLREGLLSLRASWTQDAEDMTMVGPPSADAILLLDELRNDYGWSISPTDYSAKTGSESGRTASLKTLIEDRRHL
jgi:hypothetical protein